MKELIKEEEELRKKVDNILYQKGLFNLLQEYGEVNITGSYILKTMHKKDIDISLYNPNLSVAKFYELGGKIAEILKPQGGFYRNTKVQFIKNRPPESLYWGFQFGEWKMDLWVIPKEHLDESIEYSDKILENMTEEKRELILEIKQKASSNYNKKYSSRELYSAVFKEEIKSVEEFKIFLKNTVGCEL